MEKNLQLTNTKKRRHVLENAERFSEVKKVKVSKIEYVGKEDVYNMEVKDHHNYSVAGGFIIHNCIDATRYALSQDMVKGQKAGSINIANLGFR